MKTLTLILSFILSTAFANAVTITGFGTGDTRPFTNDLGVWSYTSTLTNVSVINASDNAAPAIFSTLPSEANILGQSLLTLTGSLDSVTPSVDHFRIYLYDTSTYAAYADFTWSSFIGGATIGQSLSNDLSSGGTFNALHLQSWKLTVYGSGQTVSFTFNDLSAVPEPTSLLLLGMGLAGIAMRRSLRRR
ncbi:MAG: hypothetical protein B9S32_11970 [Verrucomicrobia bacterium Tous-C9LFEB]|nr:MAG: hypothetical protein B9S32_11970 [Verrucomicrobia bacterium Tous-C9LFEB]